MKMRFLFLTDPRAEGTFCSHSPWWARLVQGIQIGVFVAALLGAGAVAGADFTVTFPPGSASAYTINGIGNNPTLTLVRGELYTFFINNVPSNHPFFIASAGGGLTNNNIFSGTISFRVPTNAAATYSYRCSIHGFGGSITAVARPIVRIVNMNVSTNLVLRSTGTTNWNLAPEYKTNLLNSSWVALTVQTNKFASGTNETICGRPASSNVFVRIKATPK